MEIPDFSTLEIEVDEEIAFLYLNRPQKKNAMTPEMFEELSKAVFLVSHDSDIRVLIISGRGPVFSSGIDISLLNMFERMNNTEMRLRTREFQRTIRSLELMEKPVIAMINGAAIGWGFELALACDIIMASSDSIFGSMEVSFGLITNLGATQRLPRLIGVHKAKELIMTGKRISAEEADKLGLVNHVYNSNELFVKTLMLANQLKRLPAVPVGLIKILIDQSPGGGIDNGLELETQAQSICMSQIVHSQNIETANIIEESESG